MELKGEKIMCFCDEMKGLIETSPPEWLKNKLCVSFCGCVRTNVCSYIKECVKLYKIVCEQMSEDI